MGSIPDGGRSPRAISITARPEGSGVVSLATPVPARKRRSAATRAAPSVCMAESSRPRAKVSRGRWSVSRIDSPWSWSRWVMRTGTFAEAPTQPSGLRGSVGSARFPPAEGARSGVSRPDCRERVLELESPRPGAIRPHHTTAIRHTVWEGFCSRRAKSLGEPEIARDHEWPPFSLDIAIARPTCPCAASLSRMTLNPNLELGLRD